MTADERVWRPQFYSKTEDDVIVKPSPLVAAVLALNDALEAYSIEPKDLPRVRDVIDAGQHLLAPLRCFDWEQHGSDDLLRYTASLPFADAYLISAFPPESHTAFKMFVFRLQRANLASAHLLLPLITDRFSIEAVTHNIVMYGDHDMLRWTLTQQRFNPRGMNNLAIKMAAYKERYEMVAILAADPRVDPSNSLSEHLGNTPLSRREKSALEEQIRSL